MAQHGGVNIGLMDSAYFVGRKELLCWINNLLDTNFKKVEETASGPRSVPLPCVRVCWLPCRAPRAGLWVPTTVRRPHRLLASVAALVCAGPSIGAVGTAHPNRRARQRS